RTARSSDATAAHGGTGRTLARPGPAPRRSQASPALRIARGFQVDRPALRRRLRRIYGRARDRRESSPGGRLSCATLVPGAARRRPLLERIASSPSGGKRLRPLLHALLETPAL